FLFDEPLSNLDAALRGTMRLEISELHNTLKTTMIYVTHDQVEAMTMADKIVVLNRGNIEQVGSPMQLYRSPANLFVAGFIGSPRMNLMTGDYARSKNATTAGVRPEHLTLSKETGLWQGKVTVAEHLGSDTFLHLEVSGIGPITARTDGEFECKHGDTVFITPDDTKIHRFDDKGIAI
ncbi:ABC transporter ATP-binding protein, partial [Agrobacterium fabrum]